MAAPLDRDLLKESLQKIRTLRAELAARDRRAAEPIAIIGAGCRFPGNSENPDRFWQLLLDGRDAVREVPRGRWDVEAYYDPDPDVPGKSYVRSGGFLDDIEGFDADFFGIAPREAVTLDPQQRLLLEVGWEALEHAGIAPDSLRGTSTGVYVGIMTPDYALRQAHTLDVTDVDPYMLTGNDASFAAGRLSYVLGLQGPAMVMSTACSSSLVSLHTACQALRAGECDLALAGGVNALIDPVTNIMLSRLRALSRDGRCRTFDAAADGYGRGEGCGLLVLARLSDAVARGARILALVRGSAVNHDGPSAGLTVPNGSAQERLLRRALAAARVEAADVSYVEAHGTGTALGDPIELRALAAVHGPSRRQPLLVGSVKTNVGHLEAAAGVAAVLKTALALRHGIIPPHLHFRTPNPHVPWDQIGIRVPVEATEWNASPRIAGVSSFGLSGVNAHIVLEAPPGEDARAIESAVRRVLPISARSAEALEAQVARYDAWLEAHPGASWADVCHTAATGRTHFAHRTAVVASSVREARAALRDAPRARVASHDIATSTPHDADALAREYLQGAPIDWRAADREASRRRPVDLPTYAFQRTRYWVLDRQPEDAVPHAVRLAAGAEGDRTAPDRRRLAASSLEAAIAEVLGVSGLDGRTDASLVELGLDSLMATELRGWIREALEVDVELPALLSSTPVEALVAAIHARAASGRTSAAPATAGAVEHEIRFPLSAGQRALWFIHASAPESPAYNVGMAFRLGSRIDRHALTTALHRVIDRHPLLRARFRHDGDALVQEIEPRGAAVLNFVDASHWKIDELQARVLADYRRPFDLANGPAFRVSLYERGDEPVLLFALHHIICDAASCWTMLDDLRRALVVGSGERTRSAPSATYEQFVSWQNGMLASAEGARLWSYWRERLGGELPVLALPLDRERPAAQTFNGASIAYTVDRRLTGELKALARAQGVTLHVLLLATFQALLHRLTGQDDSIVGSAALARPSGFEDVVGYFVNTLPIRVRAVDDPAFTTFLAEVRAAVLGAMAHQHFPFAAMVERLQPRRDPGRPPIVQADFAVTRPPTVSRGDLLAGTESLALTPVDLAEEEGQFDIGLHVADADAELVGTFKYNADLFDASTIDRIGRCWRTLLASVTAHPETPLSALPLLSSDERARTLALGRGSDVPYESSSFIERFERQAARTPSAVAVESRRPSGASHEITYADLLANVGRLAARLGWLGVGRDVTVGIVLPRSAELATALLAVMRAGGAYVPIDPSYPDARIEWMLADARVGAVVTSAALAARVKTAAPVVRVDDRDAEPAQPDWRAEAPAPEDLAYVIYTSGSTGQPKGVAITHGGLTNYVSWALDAYDVASGCGAPVSSSIGFDATITSLLPLAAGGRIVMLPEQEAMQALATVLAEGRGFSLVKITPAHLEVLAQLLPDAACAEAARALVIGGEALRGDMLARWQQHAPSTRLFNEYGPTETVVGCCVHDVSEPVRGAVPIGRPIANTQLYVLDRHMEPVPIGVVGELYIGGAGVARGYLHRPELTRERFVPDPFDATGAGRLYRTGDLVGLRADGLFEFVGRIDDQVKLRGYRIEPAEIEAAIKEHGTVAEAAAVVREDQPGHRQLVAYVVPAQGSCDVAALRRDLVARLPEFMRPSSIVVLDRLPLTPNGKLDRAALPRPEAAPMRQRFTAPRDSTEMRLAALWEELLDVRPIGVRDDFFDLGGHSLLAVRLMARVRDAFGADIALADVLRAPTIERFADRIRAGATRRRSTLVPIQPSGSRRPFFCVPGAGGNTIYFYNLARQLGSDQPFYGLQGVGFEGEAPPHETVEQMAAHAIGEIRARQPRGPYAIGGHSLGAWVAYEMAQRLVADGEAVSLLALIDTPVPHPAAVRETSDWDQARWIVELADRIARLLDPSLSVSLEALRQLDGAAQLEAFRAALHRTDLFPGEAGAAHLANALALFRAHSRVRYTARPAPASIAVTLLRTAAPPPHLAAVAGDPTWGWGALARVDVHQLPGDHLAILRPPHVAALADVLSAALERAEAALGVSWLQRSF